MTTTKKKTVKKATKTKAVKKTVTKKTKTVKPKVKVSAKKPAWEIVMETINPVKYHGYNRPRRTSLHTLAYVCGYDDPLKLAKEMQASGKVLGYVCPDVKTPIFYLKRLAKLPGMIDTRDSRVWGKWRYSTAGATSLKDFVAKNPFPQVKGFKRFAYGGTWSGGAYGKGKYIPASSAMTVPYEKADYPYANAVIKALKKAGYKPGLKKTDIGA